jgi:hypothetical protein
MLRRDVIVRHIESFLSIEQPRPGLASCADAAGDGGTINGATAVAWHAVIGCRPVARPH